MMRADEARAPPEPRRAPCGRHSAAPALAGAARGDRVERALPRAAGGARGAGHRGEGAADLAPMGGRGALCVLYERGERAAGLRGADVDADRGAIGAVFVWVAA